MKITFLKERYQSLHWRYKDFILSDAQGENPCSIFFKISSVEIFSRLGIYLQKYSYLKTKSLSPKIDSKPEESLLFVKERSLPFETSIWIQHLGHRNKASEPGEEGYLMLQYTVYSLNDG